MPAITVFFGLLLLCLGGGVYGYLGWAVEDGAKPSYTALIPAIPGLLLVVLGLAGFVASLRPHAMHAAALVGLLALLAGGGKAVMDLVKAGGIDELERPLATASSGAMGLIALVFLVFCIRSFIAARKRNRQLADSAAKPVAEA
jgi:hypothetical protein